MAAIINDDYSNTFDGHDDASGCDYRVIFATTEADPSEAVEVDPTGPLTCLLLNFRYRCLNDRYRRLRRRRLTSWYNLELSGRITDHHLDSLSSFLDEYRVPSAARDVALRNIFDTYCRFSLVEHIKATVTIYAYNYAPFTRRSGIDQDLIVVVHDDRHDLERAMEASAADSVGPKPASREAVEALEKVTVRAEIRETSCAVCLDGFRFGIEVTRMPCSHAFHRDCIHRWLECQNFCPLCRFELPPAT